MCRAWGVTNGIKSQLSWFYGRMARELGQAAHGSARAWHLGREAGNMNVAKRVDPEYLSHMGKLVRLFDEDVESSESGWM